MLRGSSQLIRTYVQQNCGCHPLVVGVLAGLINDFLPDRGNFDRWLHAPDGGNALNLGSLDLIQRRNHILDAAIDALPDKSLQLLQRLALLQRGADVELLEALNPHLPDVKNNLMNASFLEANVDAASSNSNVVPLALSKRNHPKYREYHEFSNWKGMMRDAPTLLRDTTRDLERRGLLQYESGQRRFDLHPVVRGVVAGRMNNKEKQDQGDLVINYFNQKSLRSWEEANSLEDLFPVLQIVATLTQLERFDRALEIYKGGLARALEYNFEAFEEMLFILRPFFPEGWHEGPSRLVNSWDKNTLLCFAANALRQVDANQSIYLDNMRINICKEYGDNYNLWSALINLSIGYLQIGKLKKASHLREISLEIADANDEEEWKFISKLHLFEIYSLFGHHHQAGRIWKELNPMGRDWSRGVYRSGDAESFQANALFRSNKLTEAILDRLDFIAHNGRNRSCIRKSLIFRAQLSLERNDRSKRRSTA